MYQAGIMVSISHKNKARANNTAVERNPKCTHADMNHNPFIAIIVSYLLR